ncbi:MAG: molybdate ABC transporter substrate-binding protein [Coriobacteriales bacterium]|jgi:molybdate transport system substrate-binding protein|nr:molybdate ABC transporter substrate-binding protein [Coriobacteriales bacterium]
MRKKKLAALKGIAAALCAFPLVFALAACGAQPEPKDEASAPPSATGTPAAQEPADEPADEPAAEVELQIFAANSLEKALPEVQALYTEAHPEVTFAETQFKASGDLVEQIGAGAQADLLITASKGSMDTASEQGAIAEGSRIDMFANDLVVVRAKGSDIAFSSLEDVRSDAFSKIAIGDAATVPAGQYANQALNSIGLYSDESGKDGAYDAAIEGKVVLADKVGTAANYVATGDCQIGFVYTSDIYRYDGIEAAFTVPADAHKDIVYPGAALQASEHGDVADDFLVFCMTDPGAQAVWSQYGFEVL